jgi:hypothetical protein
MAATTQLKSSSSSSSKELTSHATQVVLLPAPIAAEKVPAGHLVQFVPAVSSSSSSSSHNTVERQQQQVGSVVQQQSA